MRPTRAREACVLSSRRGSAASSTSTTLPGSQPGSRSTTTISATMNCTRGTRSPLRRWTTRNTSMSSAMPAAAKTWTTSSSRSTPSRTDRGRQRARPSSTGRKTVRATSRRSDRVPPRLYARVTSPGRASQPQAGRYRLAALCYLRGEPGRPGDHQGSGRPVTADREAMRPVARHEDETPRADGPAVLLAEHLHLAPEQVEHLVLARVHVLVHRERGRIHRLDHPELAERVLPGRLDHGDRAVEAVGRTLTRPQHEPRCHRTSSSARCLATHRKAACTSSTAPSLRSLTMAGSPAAAPA